MNEKYIDTWKSVQVLHIMDLQVTGFKSEWLFSKKVTQRNNHATTTYWNKQARKILKKCLLTKWFKIPWLVNEQTDKKSHKVIYKKNVQDIKIITATQGERNLHHLWESNTIRKNLLNPRAKFLDSFFDGWAENGWSDIL